MKVLTFIVSCIVLMGFGCYCEAQQNSTNQIQWQTNYPKALELAKSSSKPILLLFTGSDWCGWCSQLEQEALNTSEFIQTAGQHFIFVRLDFPLYNSIEPQVAAQNKELRKKFDIRSFPTILIVDETGKQIGSTGYRAGGGKEFANHLIRIISDYKGYQNRVADLNNSKLSEQDLQKMYEKARQLQREGEANAILKVGMQQNKNVYFLRERFRTLADEGKINDAETQKIKSELLQVAPDVRQMSYDIAMIEFEANCAELEKENFSAEAAVAPLVGYIEKFKQQDPDNIWRLQMIISQVYLDSNKLSKALQYAQQSLKSAPPAMKPEIALAIDNIQAQIDR